MTQRFASPRHLITAAAAVCALVASSLSPLAQAQMPAHEGMHDHAGHPHHGGPKTGALAASASGAKAATEVKGLVDVTAAWVRPTVAGQMASGGFLTLTSRVDLTLVGVSTPLAESGELHDMRMDGGGVMRMRAMDSLALPAGQSVALQPGQGGRHLMLMGLKRPLTVGEQVPVTLLLRRADGKLVSQKAVIPVATSAAGASTGDAGAAKPSAAHAH
jgi:copper(I)-binding protein